MSNNTEIFCSIVEEEKQKLEWWLFNKSIIGELKPCDLCEDWFGAGAAPWQASPRCLAKHPSPTSGTSCNTSLSKLLSIRICIYTLVTHAALIKKAEQSWHGVPGGTAKVNRSWEAVSRVTVCWAFTTGSLIKTERKNLSSASALYHFYLQKEYFVSYKAVDNGARGALNFHHYLYCSGALPDQSLRRALGSLWVSDYLQNFLFLARCCSELQNPSMVHWGLLHRDWWNTEWVSPGSVLVLLKDVCSVAVCRQAGGCRAGKKITENFLGSSGIRS